MEYLIPMDELPLPRRRALHKRAALLSAIELAARKRLSCPSYSQMREVTGYSASGLSKLLAALREEGQIELTGGGSRLMATLPMLGLQTADPDVRRTHFPVKDLVPLAAEIWGIRTADIYGPSRKRPFVRARQSVCFVARGLGWSFPHIARMLCLEHSTVCHSVALIGHLVERDDLLRTRVNELRRRTTRERLAA